MTTPNMLSLVFICLMLSSCLNINHHEECLEEEPYQAAIPYCCKYKSGYCQSTCYNYETRYRCLSSECKEGYVWEAINDPKWWQSDRQCVPEQ